MKEVSMPNLLSYALFQRMNSDDYLCTLCGDVFSVDVDLKSHLSQKHPHLKCSDIVCSLCGKLFFHALLLKQHREQEHPKHECLLCDYKTNKKNNFERHMEAKHSERKERELCNICGESFRDVKKHVKQMHSGSNEVFYCEICGKEFKHKKDIVTHMKSLHPSHPSHQLEPKPKVMKLHECHICEYKTYRNGDYHRHVKTHKKDREGEEPKERDEDDNSRVEIKSLNCKFCDYKAPSRKSLKTHMKSKIHMEDLSAEQVAKNFKFHCTICNYKTYLSCNLKKHMKTHLNNKILKVKSDKKSDVENEIYVKTEEKCIKMEVIDSQVDSKALSTTCGLDQSMKIEVTENQISDCDSYEDSNGNFDFIGENIEEMNDESSGKHDADDEKIEESVCVVKEEISDKNSFNNDTEDEENVSESKNESPVKIKLLKPTEEVKGGTKNKNNLKKNMAELTKHQIQGCDSYKKIGTESITSFPCPECEKVFTKKKYLSKHMEIHVSDKHPCDICGKQFNRRENLFKHMKVHDSGDSEQHPCEKCGKRFSKKEQLTEHNQSMHLDEDVMCMDCGLTFDSMYKLKHHRKSHRNGDIEKHFCDQCNRLFPNTSSLKRHMEQDHFGEGHCSQCGKVFPSFVTLKRHVKQVHMLERKHICDVCSKAFKSQSHLLRHKKNSHKRI